MSAATLIDRTSFSTADPEVARDFLGQAFGETRLSVRDPLIGDGVLSVDQASTPTVSVSRFASPAELDVTYIGLDDQVVFTDFAAGHASIDHGGWENEDLVEMVPGDLMLTIQPGQEWKHHTKSVKNFAIGISETLLREVSGADPTDSGSQWAPIGSRPIPRYVDCWRTTASYLDWVFNFPAIRGAPLVVREAERVMAAVTTAVFPNRLQPAPAPDHKAPPALLRRAIAFIEANPHRDISLADVAEAAHCVPRTLQVAFRKHLDTTPRAYLRGVRLDLARDELVASTPEETTVAEVAANCGFASPSRFAGAYNERFGELPRSTLGR